MYAVKTIKTKKLVSTFKKSNGKKHNLTIKNPTVEKSTEEIREAMELLTTLEIFQEDDDVKTFAEIDTCKYVETTNYILFDPEHPVEATEPAVAPQPVETPVIVAGPKPKYEKYIDLVCPRTLENLANVNVASSFKQIEALSDLKPCQFAEQANDRSDSNAPTDIEAVAVAAVSDEKERKGKNLLTKIKEILLGSSP